MPISLCSKRVLQGVILTGILVTLVFMGRQFQRGQSGWDQAMQGQNIAQPKHAIGLPDFVAKVHAMPIAGVDQALSGLTYDPGRNSLFAITHPSPQVIELSLQGRVLRQIPLLGFRDPEAIVHIGTGRFLIVQERGQRLLEVRLTDDTTEIDATDAHRLTFDLGKNGSKGYEGLAYDPSNRRVFVAQERDLVRILEIRGLPQFDPSEPLAASEESHVLLEIGAHGKFISHLSLRGGPHELMTDIAHAQGMTTDASGTIYIVSKPNLFYVFEKKPRG